MTNTAQCHFHGPGHDTLYCFVLLALWKNASKGFTEQMCPLYLTKNKPAGHKSEKLMKQTLATLLASFLYSLKCLLLTAVS